MAEIQIVDLEFRNQKLIRKLAKGDIAALALNPGPSMAYFTGLDFHLMERPILAILRTDGKMIFILPELEAGKLQNLKLPHEAFAYGEDPATWQAVFNEALAESGLVGRKIGLEPRRLRVLELSYLENAIHGAEIVSAADIVAGLRAIKGESELAAMRRAVAIAERALRSTLAAVRLRMTERELAGELTAHLLREGSDPELPFAPLVAFGSRSASPHAFPTDRKLVRDELVLIDWGAGSDGYYSDITRMFKVGNPNPELLRIADIVAEANQAARSVVAPGVTAGAVDRAAREVITAAGFGERFIHRTGHGLGMEAHEEPGIYQESGVVLQPGMTFTIEPGIYMPGLGGARVEDDVVVTETGLQTLTTLPRKVTAIEVSG